MLKRLCTICARGGSKGVKNKNIKELQGVPLIAYSIKLALDSNLFDCVAVSSDSDAILETATTYGAQLAIKRPAELATDKAGKLDAMVHALRFCEQFANCKYDFYVDLDATSPLRQMDDLKLSIEILEQSGCSNVLTAAEARRSPYFNLLEQFADNSVGLSKKFEKEILRRQDSPKCFDMNASIYAWDRNKFIDNPSVFYPDTKLMVMPAVRSVDIDEELDWIIVETILKNQLHLKGKSYVL